MSNTSFEILDNGIYRANWRTTNRQDIEQYGDWFMGHLHDLPADSTMKILHDYRETTTPSFQRLKEVMGRLTLRDEITLRIAHIYSDNLYPVIMQNATLVSGMTANRKFFKPSEEADAIAWLLNA